LDALRLIIHDFMPPSLASRMIQEPSASREVGDDQLRVLRRWLVYLALLLAAAGLVSVAVGSFMPAYTDPVVAERISIGLECEPGIRNTNENLQCDSELWYRTMKALRTDKWSLVDVGGGLLLSGLMMSVFFWWSRQKSWRQLSTPRSSLSILALAGLCWLMQIPAYALFFITELTRGYYPPWADSIAIPMFQFTSILLSLFLPYMALWLFFVVGARLPVAVFSTVPGRPFVNAFWSGAATLLFIPIGLILIGAILEGPILMVPFLWLTLWLVLSARAAALTRHRRYLTD
jgi:hypothetical protein